MGAYHRTSDGQEHKIIWRAGLERDAIFSLSCHGVQRARQPLSRLALVASRWQGTSCSSSFVSKVLIHVSVVLHRPDNQVQLPSTLDMGTTVPIAITIMFNHIFLTCDIMYTCMCCVGAATHYSTTHNIN